MRAYWVIGMTMTAGLHAQTKNCSVDVYVLTGVPAPAGMLGEAKKQATRMFREIGVNLRVRDSAPSHQPSDACGAPIVIQIEAAAGYRGHNEALAYANPYKGFGTCIHVFLDRVMGRSPEPGFVNALLAHVMVHEITHVMEGINRHSDEGVMKAVWSEEDYRRLRREPLAFAPEDVRLIHEGVSRRNSSAAAE